MMQLSLLRVAPLSGSVDLSADLMHRLLWQDHPAGVEHIRVRAGPGGFAIAVFTNAPDQMTSDGIARQLIRTTLTSAPELRLWRLL